MSYRVPKADWFKAPTGFERMWIGLALVLLGFLFKEKIRILCLGIGFGLLIDEFGFMIKGGGSFADYWSLYSIISVIVLLGIFYLTRKKTCKSIFN